VEAALHRLGRCRELLLSELAAAEGGEATAGPSGAVAARNGVVEEDDSGSTSVAAAAACRLGAVCGSLADARRRGGDLPGAEGALRESAGHLRGHAAGDAGAAAALSVTLGKLGDLQFFKAQADAEALAALAAAGTAVAAAAGTAAAASGGSGGGGDDSGNGGGGGTACAGGEREGGAAEAAGGCAEGSERAAAAAALPFYEEALEHRRALCGPLTGGRVGPCAMLDLVGALVRVADAHEVRPGCWIRRQVVGAGCFWARRPPSDLLRRRTHAAQSCARCIDAAPFSLCLAPPLDGYSRRSATPLRHSAAGARPLPSSQS
jgi:hypothetical protein